MKKPFINLTPIEPAIGLQDIHLGYIDNTYDVRPKKKKKLQKVSQESFEKLIQDLEHPTDRKVWAYVLYQINQIIDYINSND